MARVDAYLAPLRTASDVPFFEDERDILVKKEIEEDEPIEVPQKYIKISFLGKSIIVALSINGRVYIGMKGVCQILGVSINGQVTRLTYFSPHFFEHIKKLLLPSRGGLQAASGININMMEEWLNSLALGRITTETRNTVEHLTSTHCFSFSFPDSFDPEERFESIVSILSSIPVSNPG